MKLESVEVGSCRRAAVSYRRPPRGKNRRVAVTNDGVRLELLLQAGFSPRLAARLAADARYDVHRLIELVERGCPPLLAVRILAPLDDPAEAA